MLVAHIPFQPDHRIGAVEGARVNGVAAHSGNKGFVVAAHDVGSCLLRVGLGKAVLREDDAALEMAFAVPLGLPELLHHFGIGDLDILRPVVDCPVRGHAVELALLIADDGDRLIKRTKLLDVALDCPLKSFQGIADFCHPRQLAGLAKNHLDGGFLESLCQLRVKRNLLKTDVVAEVKRGCAVLPDDLHDIRHGHGLAFVIFGPSVIIIKHTVHIFQTGTVHFALKYSVIDFTVDFGQALDLPQSIQAYKTNSVASPVWVDLVNCDVHNIPPVS